MQASDFTTSESEFSNFYPMEEVVNYDNSSSWETFKDQKTLKSLYDYVEKLELRVNYLEEISRNSKNSYAISINDLASAKYRLNSQIYIFISKENDYFLAEAVDFDVYAVGETEKETVNKFKEILVRYFDNLNNPNQNLSENLKSKRELLKKLISNEK